MAIQNLIAVYRKAPKELFRVNNGLQIKLRAWAPHRNVYDIIAHDGFVEPKALNESSYIAPNGASMRPNTRYQQSLVSWRFRGNDIRVFSIPAGTALPEHLLLVHERSDHYSLQPRVRMTLSELDDRITQFMTAHGKVYTRDQWLQAFPKPTEQF